MIPLTDLALRRYYRLYNEKFFGNKLPRHLTVCFGRMPKRGFIGQTRFKKGRPEFIHISRKYGRSIQLMTLLHEMVHVRLNSEYLSRYRDLDNSCSCNGTGRLFNAEMLRLAKKGAFYSLW